MKPAPFEYCRADTLDEALDLMAEFGSDAAVLAGGMSLGPMLNMRLARPAAIVDVNPVEDLSGIRLLGQFGRNRSALPAGRRARFRARQR